MSAVPSSLAWAHPLVADWFVQRFGTPTEPQEQGWPHILAGRTTLISAPTGSGKTLAAVGWALRRRELRMAAGRSACPIIYALPFTSIIDQNASVLGRVWGNEEPDESTLGIHHHVAEPGEIARSGEQSLEIGRAHV